MVSPHKVLAVSVALSPQLAFGHGEEIAAGGTAVLGVIVGLVVGMLTVRRNSPINGGVPGLMWAFAAMLLFGLVAAGLAFKEGASEAGALLVLVLVSLFLAMFFAVPMVGAYMAVWHFAPSGSSKAERQDDDKVQTR
jgi:hypothetical protein